MSPGAARAGRGVGGGLAVGVLLRGPGVGGRAPAHTLTRPRGLGGGSRSCVEAPPRNLGGVSLAPDAAPAGPPSAAAAAPPAPGRGSSGRHGLGPRRPPSTSPLLVLDASLGSQGRPSGDPHRVPFTSSPPAPLTSDPSHSPQLLGEANPSPQCAGHPAPKLGRGRHRVAAWPHCRAGSVVRSAPWTLSLPLCAVRGADRGGGRAPPLLRPEAPPTQAESRNPESGVLCHPTGFGWG